MIKGFIKKFSASFTAAAMFTTMIAAAAFAADTDGVDWANGVVSARGLASGKNRPQARRAAIMDAQRNLAEQVAGVQVTAESSMKDLMLEYDVVRTSVNAMIRGMHEAAPAKYYEDGSCEVELEMPIYGSGKSVAAAAFSPYAGQEKEPFPEPSSNARVSGVYSDGMNVYRNEGAYTGLVIDCSDMNLNPVMSPVIRNDGGQAIYGHRNLDIDKVIELGMASYAEDTNDEISHARAGKNPLVVKAVKLEGFNANPVVSIADSDKILIANQNDQFLDNLNVVFVK